MSFLDSVAPDYYTAQKAVVVGVFDVQHPQTKGDYDFQEIRSLLKTLGVETVFEVTQKRRKLDPRYCIGSGKVDEIKVGMETHEASVVVVDQGLSPPQLNNLQASFNCMVMDRTGVILEIFRQHAKTNQAKTQVEIARLEYLLPRMVGAWTHLERQKGGGGGGAFNRGMGEKQVEVDRRRAREKIHRLKSKLKQFSSDRTVQRRQRQKEFTVALVGYTNSGKSSLMNALTESGVLVEDKLFASLDAKVKTIDHHSRPRILLIDTVGFIRNLPHSLVDSFRSTLEEALTADLLLNVIDTSDPHYREHMEVTDEVLKTIGGDHIPQLMVYNKSDLIEDKYLGKILGKGSQFISANDPKDVKQLRDAIDGFFLENFVSAEVSVPAENHDVISFMQKECIVGEFSHQETVLTYHVLVHQNKLTNLKRVVSKYEQCTIKIK